MTQNDLRLGNLLRHKKGQICTVVSISNGWYHGVQVQEIEIESIDDLQPIPLTQKTFLDSGFKHIKGSAIVIFDKGDFSVEVHLNAKSAEIKLCFLKKVKPCKPNIYFHDLQNAHYMATAHQLTNVIKLQ